MKEYKTTEIISYQKNIFQGSITVDGTINRFWELILSSSFNGSFIGLYIPITQLIGSKP